MPRKEAPDASSEGELIKRVMVPMPDSLHHRIRVMAAERRTTMQAIIRDALERGLGAEDEGRRRRSA
jgi:hypothetical protein